MKHTKRLLAISLLVFSATLVAQEEKKSEEEFVKESPTIGEMLPDVTVFRPDGGELKTSELRGHYTVLTFGCLT